MSYIGIFFINDIDKPPHQKNYPISTGCLKSVDGMTFGYVVGNFNEFIDHIHLAEVKIYPTR